MASSSEEEDALLAEMKASWSEYLRFYSRSGKEDRERWVVESLLNFLSIDFEPNELRSPPQESKVDVEFRTGRFQVKEIPDPNIRRTDEIKDTHRRVMAAKTLQETVGPGIVYDVPAPARGYELVLENARKQSLEEKYLRSKRSLDLLFYITRARTSVVVSNEVNRAGIKALGWRSVSCLIRNRALVLYAAHDAPAFLRQCEMLEMTERKDASV